MYKDEVVFMCSMVGMIALALGVIIGQYDTNTAYDVVMSSENLVVKVKFFTQMDSTEKELATGIAQMFAHQLDGNLCLKSALRTNTMQLLAVCLGITSEYTLQGLEKLRQQHENLDKGGLPSDGDHRSNI